MSGFIGTKLTMNLGERSYDIILKNGALENLYQFARLDRRVAVVRPPRPPQRRRGAEAGEPGLYQSAGPGRHPELAL